MVESLIKPKKVEFQFKDMNGVNLAVSEFTSGMGANESYIGEGEKIQRVTKGPNFTIYGSNLTSKASIETEDQGLRRGFRIKAIEHGGQEIGKDSREL